MGGSTAQSLGLLHAFPLAAGPRCPRGGQEGFSSLSARWQLKGPREKVSPEPSSHLPFGICPSRQRSRQPGGRRDAQQDGRSYSPAASPETQAHPCLVRVPARCLHASSDCPGRGWLLASRKPRRRGGGLFCEMMTEPQSEETDLGSLLLLANSSGCWELPGVPSGATRSRGPGKENQFLVIFFNGNLYFFIIPGMTGSEIKWA